MNLAYIVSGVQAARPAHATVSRLRTGTSQFLIHVDKKTDEVVFPGRMTETMRRLSNLVV
jgi:hypothetical protein